MVINDVCSDNGCEGNGSGNSGYGYGVVKQQRKNMRECKCSAEFFKYTDSLIEYPKFAFKAFAFNEKF